MNKLEFTTGLLIWIALFVYCPLIVFFAIAAASALVAIASSEENI